MRRCIVHIGMHKTGSTSIQQSLHRFSDERFMYAALDDASNHSVAMYSAFSSNPEKHHLHRHRGRDAASVRAYASRMREALDRCAAQAGGRTLVISGEDISVLARFDVLRMRDYLRARFDEVEIVAYVRSPGEFIASSFQERVKGGSIGFDPRQMYRNYEKTFAKFDDVFGRQHVQLRKFDPSGFPDGCAVRDFCSRIGLQLPAARIVRINESLSRQMVGLLYTYRKLGARAQVETLRGPECMRLAVLLRGMRSDKFRFAPEFTRPLLEDNRADIAWMEARLGASLAEDLGEPRTGDVRSEADLFVIEPHVAEHILKVLGPLAPEGGAAHTAQDAARLVQALRDKLARETADGSPAGAQAGAISPSGEGAMRVSDLLKEIRAQDAALPGELSPEQAEGLLAAVFKCMNDNLRTAQDGVLTYPGLGQFHVQKPAAGAGRPAAAGTRIVFRRAARASGEAA
jgi:hypothetical protein